MLATIIECTDLDAEVSYFRDRLGFSVHLVSPADDPRRIVMRSDGGGLVELIRADVDRPATIAVHVDPNRSDLPPAGKTPGGTRVELRPDPAQMPEPALGAEMLVPDNVPSLTVVDAAEGAFGLGRAGMEYRDLLPDRWGGRFIASHIRIIDGGDVADWVHFHRIRFQMIYVAAGWVDVVYEGQGEAFRMVAGDCVLQPPLIRHRVLRSSPGLEVIEVGCPAEHDTLADHELELPTATTDADRDFDGQRFVRHVDANSAPHRWVHRQMNARSTGIGAATDGLAEVIVVGPRVEPGLVGPVDLAGTTLLHDGEFVLIVGLEGDAVLRVGEREVALGPRVSVAVPPGTPWSWSTASPVHRALLVSLPHTTIREA